MSNTAQKKTQRKTRAQRAADELRANERARKMPGIFEFEVLVNDLYSPARGVSTKRPRDDVWTFKRGRAFGAHDLKRHVEQKESLAVTWGERANVRVIDVDAHDGSDPKTVLPVVWEQVQALHYARGIVIPDMKGTEIPKMLDGSPLPIAGVIATTPRGAHYEERLEPSEEETAYADKMRVEACLEHYGVKNLDGKVEVMPNQNGGSRLPLGHGCTFLWPPVGKVDLETGIEILSSLKPVPREFSDFPFVVPRRDQDVPLDEFIECTQLDEEPICEYDPDEPTFPAPPSVISECKLDLVPQIYEGGDVPKRSEAGEVFIRETEMVRENGADCGKRNQQLWNMCFLLRLTKGLSREAATAEMTTWIDNAPHTSADLSDKSKRNENLRQVHRLMNKIDAKLASGEFFIGGSGRSAASWDPLLMFPNDASLLPTFEALGLAELRRVDGTSMLDGLPTWMQTALPALVGAIKRYTVGGRIVIPVNAVKAYARTNMSKKCPFTGDDKKAYQVLLDALVRFGIIGGLISAGNVAKRKASVYESNVEEDANERRADGAEVDPAGRVPEAESGDESELGQGSGTDASRQHAAEGSAREVVCGTDEGDSRHLGADVQGSEDAAPAAPTSESFAELLAPWSVRKVFAGNPSGGRGQGASSDGLDAGRHCRHGDTRLVS